MNHWKTLLVMFVILLFVAPASNALTIDVFSSPELDGYYSMHNSTLHSSNDRMLIHTRTIGNYPRDNRGMMEIDLRAIPDIAVINMVRLRVYAHRGDITQNVELYSYLADGVLEAADWDPLGTKEDTQHISSSGWQQVDFSVSTTFIQTALNSTGFAGFQFYDPSHNDYGGVEILTAEVGGALRPYMTVEYEVSTVPEPSTMLLLGTGLIGIGAISRRRYKRS